MTEKKMTGFGKKVRLLAQEKDVYNWAQLERVLQDSGYDYYSRQILRNYAYGDTVAPADFVRAFSEVFDLDEEEKKEIAYLWAFEQECEDKPLYRTPVYDVAQRVGWEDEQKQEIAYRYIF